MKFGIMESDVTVENMLVNSSAMKKKQFREVFCQEGKRIYELLYRVNGEKEYLHQDKDVKTDEDFYEAVLCEYMIEELLKEKPYIRKKYEDYRENELRIRKEWGMAQEFRWVNKRAFLSNYEYDCNVAANPPEPLHPVIQEALNPTPKPQVQCPYCKSTRVEKIGSVSRAVSIFALGFASGKIGKQWHCKDCKSDF